MSGKIFGIGIGPGNPDLLTLRAANCIRNADIICLPQLPKEQCRAYRIAQAAVPEIAAKECLCLDFRMTRDARALAQIHEAGYRAVLDLYRAGKSLGFLTIGDPAVYSTFGYIAQRARRDRLEMEIVPGVPAFCAAAAGLGMPLCEGDRSLHIVSGQGDVEAALRLTGTIVIMKCGKNLPRVKALLLGMEREEQAQVCAVSECGMPEEKRCCGAANIPDDGGYMTTIIVTRPGLAEGKG